MNVCSKCGLEMKDDARFCKACGSGAKKADDALIAEKKARVTATEERGGRKVLIAVGALVAVLLVVIVAGAFRGSRSGKFMSSSAPGPGVAAAAPAMVRESNGTVRIALADLGDGRAHFYAYEGGSGAVRFFLIRKDDGSIGVALDACNSCYRAKRGYRQDGKRVVCNNCNMAFDPKDVGIVTGGCNPIPVPFTQEAGAVVVRTADLEKGRMYF